MKKFLKNNIKSFIIITFFIILSLILEIFVFNKSYWLNEKENRGIIPIELNVELKDIKRQDNNYIFTSNNSYIKINKINKYIDYLVINVSTNEDLNVLITANNNQIYKGIINNIEKTRYFNVNKKVQSISFVFEDQVDKNINIDKINIDNTFCFNIFRFIFILIILIFLYFVFKIKNIKNIKLEYVFLFISLIIGLTLSIYIPVFFTFDEKEHFVRSYNLAQGNFNMTYGEKISWPKKVEEFLEFRKEAEAFRNRRTYKEFLNDNNNNLNYNSHEKNYYHSTAAAYTFIPYVFSGLGIKIASVFKLPFIYSFYVGRIFNAIAYFIIVFYALKMIKEGKKTMFIIALLPAIIYQAGTYSADVLTNAFAFLSVSSILCLLQNEKINKKYLLLFIISTNLLILSKIAYFPFILLILTLRKNKFKNKKENILIKTIAIMSSILSIAYCLYVAKNGKLVQWPIPGVNIIGQTKLIILHPLRYLFILLKTINSEAVNFVNGITSSLSYSGNLGYGIMFLCLLILIFVSNAENNKSKINLFTKIIFAFVSLSVILSVSASMYITFNPYAADRINGIQGRYFVPILLLFLLIISSKKIKINISEKTLNIITIISVLTMLLLTLLFMFYKFCR